MSNLEAGEGLKDATKNLKNSARRHHRIHRIRRVLRMPLRRKKLQKAIRLERLTKG
jgi:hypothetical protein